MASFTTYLSPLLLCCSKVLDGLLFSWIWILPHEGDHMQLVLSLGEINEHVTRCGEIDGQEAKLLDNDHYRQLSDTKHRNNVAGMPARYPTVGLTH